MQAPQTTLKDALPHSGKQPLARRWDARLRLGFEHRAWGTVLGQREHEGPLRVQKPFYPEGRGVCHVYVLHPPGGLVQGDCLTIDVCVGAKAHALLTTPAAAKVYRSAEGHAAQTVKAEVHSDGTLEWFPQETIVFSGARARLKTQIALTGTGKLMAWEIICLGRPACNETFDAGSCTFHFDLTKDGEPVHFERSVFVGGSDVLRARWGLAGHAAMGTFVVHPACTEALQAARLPCAESLQPEMCAATLVQGTLICRVLAADAGLVRDRFVKLWHLLRPLCLGLTASPPRIWAT